MFLIRKYIAFLFLSVFLLRVCAIQVALADNSGSAIGNLIPSDPAKEFVRISSGTLLMHEAHANLDFSIVSEESLEDDNDEKLSKNAKYPAFMTAFLASLYPNREPVTGKTYYSSIFRASDKTFLTLSVLRI